MADKKAERDKARQWARDLLASGRFRIVDFETTGIDDRAEIVQISVIDPAGTAVLDTLVKPQEHIPTEVTRIHGISDATVKDAPSFPEVYVRLTTALAGETAVAYNVAFERRILGGVCKRHGLPAIKPRQWTCAMENYAAFWGDWNASKNSFSWQRLTNACTQQGIVVADAHSALGDALMTLRLMEKMAEGE